MKIANVRYGNECNSKPKYCNVMGISPVVDNNSCYKTMKSFVFNDFAFLNDAAKYPDWPLPGYHGNREKNPASWFCAYCPYAPIP